ncbi:MAG: FAD binding domain-containing protein, partial [Gemmatimonadota bacterium]
MKPPPFEYFAPDTPEEALGLLVEHGYDAKPLAGGQSLIPMLNFRLASPAVLVDLNRIGSLAGIEPGEDGGLWIRAMTRQREAERSPLVAERAPLLAEAMSHVAHPQIRNRGTVGGSAAHADPAAELPAVLLALKARLRIRGAEGERVLPAAEFFAGLFTTALGPEELLVAVEIPPPAPGWGWAFEEVARRHGDYALVGVAAGVRIGEAGRCEEARLAYVNGGPGAGAAPGAGAGGVGGGGGGAGGAGPPAASGSAAPRVAATGAGSASEAGSRVSMVAPVFTWNCTSRWLPVTFSTVFWMAWYIRRSSQAMAKGVGTSTM